MLHTCLNVATLHIEAHTNGICILLVHSCLLILNRHTIFMLILFLFSTVYLTIFRLEPTMLAYHLRLSLLLAVTLTFGIVKVRPAKAILRLTREEIKDAFSALFKTSSQIRKQMGLSVKSVSTSPRGSLDNITSGRKMI